jgi:hypothetical protein
MTATPEYMAAFIAISYPLCRSTHLIMMGLKCKQAMQVDYDTEVVLVINPQENSSLLSMSTELDTLHLLMEMVNWISLCLSIKTLQSNNGVCERKIGMQKMSDGKSREYVRVGNLRSKY